MNKIEKRNILSEELKFCMDMEEWESVRAILRYASQIGEIERTDAQYIVIKNELKKKGQWYLE